MIHTQIPKDELEVFKSLTDIRVVFDIGARDDVDYLILKPGIELHAFEPNILFFKELSDQVAGMPNVYLNNFALGYEEGMFAYNDGAQAVGEKVDAQSPSQGIVQVMKLDRYISEHGITRIDFLKMDVEGYEPTIIKGGQEAMKLCRYIQYEQGKNSSKTDFDRLLPESEFDLYYTGYRNVLAVRKGELVPWLPEEPKEGGQSDKDDSNKLK